MVRLWWPQPARPPPQRWHQAAEHSEAPPRGCAATARHHMAIDRRFLGVFSGVSSAVVADTPPIAAPRRRQRGHEGGGLDDDGGVVTMACKVGDDGGSVVVMMDSPEVASSE
ncbi:hypothetical protein Tco_1324917 [Tanacetum coccineum]